MRRLVAITVSTAALSLGFGVPAHAGQAVGTCPDDYQLVKTFKGDPIDVNANRYICQKPIPSPNPNPGGQGESLVIDDHL